MRRFLSQLLHRLGDWFYDAVLPPACDQQIFEEGQPVFYISDMPAMAIEAMVTRIRAETRIKVDWFYFGGQAIIKVLGSRDDMAYVMNRIHAMLSSWREPPLPPTKEL